MRNETEREFKWTSTLSGMPGYAAELKREPEDFIVREIGPDGIPAEITDVFSFSDMEHINKLPLLDSPDIAEAWETVVSGSRAEQKPRVLCVVSGIPSKEARKLVHTAYSHHPLVYTRNCKQEKREDSEDCTSICVIFDPRHRNTIYSAVITKRERTTQDAVERIARQLGIPGRCISYAGNKDKRGITSQRITIASAPFQEIYMLCMNPSHTSPGRVLAAVPRLDSMNHSDIPADTPRLEFTDIAVKLEDAVEAVQGRTTPRKKCYEKNGQDQYPEDIAYLKQVLQVQDVKISSIKREEASILLGQLHSNRFHIALRTKDADAKTVTDSVEILRTQGFPNYYGSQRFGYGMSNPRIGQRILEGRHKEAVDLILASLSHSSSPKVSEAQAYIQRKEYVKALEVLPKKYLTERHVLRGLATGQAPGRIFRGIRREARMLYVHSYQSMVFNDALEEALKNPLGTEEYVTDAWVGSITSKEDIEEKVSRSTSADMSNWVLPLFPTPGVKDNQDPAVGVGSILGGGFRKAVIVPRRLSSKFTGPSSIPDTPTETRMGTLHISFDIPPGVYATMLIKEITGNKMEEIREGIPKREGIPGDIDKP